MNETTTDPSSADETAAEQAHEGTDAPAAESAETASPAETAGSGETAEPQDAGESEREAEDDAESDEERVRRLEEEGDIAADYLEELLDIADLDGDIDIDVEGDRASVEIRGADRLAALNRPKGELLDALQELARLAVQTRTGARSRLMLDIGGFRAEHKGSL